MKIRPNSRRQAFGKFGFVQQPDAKKNPPRPKYFRRFSNSASVSTKSLCPFMKRKGVSKRSGSVSRTLRSSWILSVDARETSFIKSSPTPAQSLPSFELYLTRPMKKVAFLSSVPCT